MEYSYKNWGYEQSWQDIVHYNAIPFTFTLIM
jgi:hypothetical protein